MPENRTWVLLRGLVREQRHWENFPDKLRLYFPDDDIILYDFPGNGRRYKEKSATTITAMLNDLRSFVRHQSVSKPVHIIALSLGAMVAVEWMNRQAEECAASVLISTSLRGLNPFYQRLLPATYPAIFRLLLLPVSNRQKESTSLKLVSNIVANDVAKSEIIINHWLAYAEQCPVSGINGLRQLLAANHFRVPKIRPDVPMLVLNSLADRLVSPQCSEKLADYWHLAIETHATAGHDIPLDDAEWVCEKIVKWLSTLHCKSVNNDLK